MLIHSQVMTERKQQDLESSQLARIIHHMLPKSAHWLVWFYRDSNGRVFQMSSRPHFHSAIASYAGEPERGKPPVYSILLINCPQLNLCTFVWVISWLYDLALGPALWIVWKQHLQTVFTVFQESLPPTGQSSNVLALPWRLCPNISLCLCLKLQPNQFIAVGTGLSLLSTSPLCMLFIMLEISNR